MTSVSNQDSPSAEPPPSASNRKLIDSPWAWVAMFLLVGLAGVIAISPKIAARRQQLATKFLGRQQAMEIRSEQIAGSEDPSAHAPAADERIGGSLWLVVVIAGGGLVLAGFAVYVLRAGTHGNRGTSHKQSVSSTAETNCNEIPRGETPQPSVDSSSARQA